MEGDNVRTIISTDKAPAAVGPYSQAVKVGNLAFISGQIPINPQNGELVRGDIVSQTRQVLDNLKAIIEACGSSLEKTVKVTIFLTDMDNFATVNGIYSEYFSQEPPARACVEVSRLPKNVAVEMDAVVLCD